MPVRANGTTTFQVDSQRVAPKRERGFALIARHGKQNFARNGNDERHDHDGEHDSRRQKADAVGRPLEKRQKPERVLSAPARMSSRISGTTIKMPSNP